MFEEIMKLRKDNNDYDLLTLQYFERTTLEEILDIINYLYIMDGKSLEAEEVDGKYIIDPQQYALDKANNISTVVPMIDKDIVTSLDLSQAIKVITEICTYLYQHKIEGNLSLLRISYTTKVVIDEILKNYKIITNENEAIYKDRIIDIEAVANILIDKLPNTKDYVLNTISRSTLIFSLIELGVEYKEVNNDIEINW